MHIEYIKTFYEVASNKSISKVANQSHISQPALSQQIQRLEDSVGLKLLERSNKGVELTEAGKIVEKYSKNLIKLYENMLQDIRDIKKNNSTIRICASPVLATYALPCTIYKVKEKYPNYIFNLTSCITAEAEQQILNDSCDVCFTIGKPNDESLLSFKIASDRMVAVASPDFKLKKDLSCGDLKCYPLIMLEDKIKLRVELNNYFSKLGCNLDDFNILFNMDSSESVKSTVVKGYGLSFLPYISIKKELYTKQIIEINIQDFEMTYDIYMSYKKDWEFDKDTRNLIHYLKIIGEKSFC